MVRGPIDILDQHIRVETRDGDNWVTGMPCSEGYRNMDVRFLKLQFDNRFVLMRSSTLYSCIGGDFGHISYTSNGISVSGGGGAVGKKLINLEIYFTNY